jgi:WD40 repeat protein
LPWLLISGGDDSQIALWDIRTDSLVTNTLGDAVYEPSISISSLSSHPGQPFLLISGHLDNSLILWDLLGLPDVQLAQLKLILDMPPDSIITSNVNEGML